jgi:SAM-dependent methyltransferase
LHYALHSDPQSSHQQIVRLVRGLGRSPILDVGAAQGFLGQLLQHDGLALDAVEPNPVWAAHAQPFYRRVHNSRIEQAELPLNTYKIVVCADVLEHVVDPVDTLRRLQSAATPDAFFIISLPNIAHLAARLLLLFGQFPKMPHGIFDRTHLHFFTRATATDMLRSAGLELVKLRCTPAPLELVWPAWLGQPLLHMLMAVQRVGLLAWPTLFGYQWIMLARPAQGKR